MSITGIVCIVIAACFATASFLMARIIRRREEERRWKAQMIARFGTQLNFDGGEGERE